MNTYRIVSLTGRTIWRGTSYVEALSHYNTFVDNGIRCSLVEVEDYRAELARAQALYGY